MKLCLYVTPSLVLILNEFFPAVSQEWILHVNWLQVYDFSKISSSGKSFAPKLLFVIIKVIMNMTPRLSSKDQTLRGEFQSFILDYLILDRLVIVCDLIYQVSLDLWAQKKSPCLILIQFHLHKWSWLSPGLRYKFQIKLSRRN